MKRPIEKMHCEYMLTFGSLVCRRKCGGIDLISADAGLLKPV